jgi:hypothetical protein
MILSYTAIALFIPLIILQLSLQVFCLIRLYKTEFIKYLPKLAWAIIIIVGGLVGALVFIILKPFEE